MRVRRDFQLQQLKFEFVFHHTAVGSHQEVTGTVLVLTQ